VFSGERALQEPAGVEGIETGMGIAVVREMGGQGLSAREGALGVEVAPGVVQGRVERGHVVQDVGKSQAQHAVVASAGAERQHEK